MIEFIIGSIIGGIIGFSTAAMLTVSKVDNQKED